MDKMTVNFGGYQYCSINNLVHNTRFLLEMSRSISALHHITYSRACKTGRQEDAERCETDKHHFTWQRKEYVESSGWYGGTSASHTHLLTQGKWRPMLEQHMQNKTEAIWKYLLCFNKILKKADRIRTRYRQTSLHPTSHEIKEEARPLLSSVSQC